MKYIVKIFVLIVSLSFFYATIYFTGCSHQNRIEITQEEKIWMDKFLKDLFLEGSMLYPLYEEKPMSGMTISIPNMKEWIDAAKPYLDTLSQTERKDKLKEMIEYCEEYDLHKNWNKWVKWKTRYKRHKVLFRKLNTQDPNQFNIEIIHVKSTSNLLKEKKEVFVRELGMDFDPDEVVSEFEDPDSRFWECVFSNHFLLGILYGFGEGNALQFSKEHRIGRYSGTGIESDGDGGSISELALPVFRSYQKKDPLEIHYRKVRKKIQKDLSKKDFTNEILQRIIDPSSLKSCPLGSL